MENQIFEGFDGMNYNFLNISIGQTWVCVVEAEQGQSYFIFKIRLTEFEQLLENVIDICLRKLD